MSSITWQTVTSIVQPLASGTKDGCSVASLGTLADQRRIRDLKILGVSVLTRLIQSAQQLRALSLILRGWDSVTTTPMPLAGRILLGAMPFAPIVIDLLRNENLLNHTPRVIKKICIAIDNHGAKVAKVAAAVACVVLVVMGQPLFGGAALALLAANSLAESELVGSRGRYLLKNALPCLWSGATLIVGDPLSKILAVCHLAHKIFDLFSDLYRAWQKRLEQEALARRELPQVNLEAFRLLQSGATTVTVDPKHLPTVNLVGREPTFSLRDAHDSHLRRLRIVDSEILELLDGDKGWKQALDDEVAENNLAGKVAYIQRGFSLLIHQLDEEQIIEDEPLDYKPLRIRAKQILEMIDRIPSESEHCRQYAELALMGYENGSEITYRLNAKYNELRQQPLQLEHATLSEQIHVSLAALRSRLCREAAEAAVQTLVGEPERLHHEEVEREGTPMKRWLHNHLRETFSLLNPLDRGLSLIDRVRASFGLFRHGTVKQVEQAVHGEYSVSAMVAHIRDELTTGGISLAKVDGWLDSWERHGIRAEQLRQQDGSYSDAALTMLLTEFGVYTLSPS